MITKEIEKVHSNEINFSKNLKGYTKRCFLAAFFNDHEYSKSKVAKIFGVTRNLLRKALKEFDLKKEIKPKIETRGRKSIEEKYPELANDIQKIVDNYSQTDPKFKTEKMYVRLTVNNIISALIDTGKYTINTLPKKSAINNYLNKLGYNLKKVKKTIPLKKVPETDAIFNNINETKEKYMNDDDTVIISIDTKDKVKLGDYSRDGYNRTEVNALDHDFESGYITPFGILDLKTNETILYNTKSKVTSDFMVDSIISFWKEAGYSNKKRLVIFLDNGPENSSRRTRFIYRLILFADMYNIEIEMVYYPPYHSKYNPVERIWARLENIWNGSLLSNEEVCLNFMNNMSWKGVKTIAYLIEKEYKIGVKESKETMLNIEKYISRKVGIERWAFSINII